ncbi:MAG: LysM peptidoglycan-binding domain-containing protein [Mariniphaga sp.]|nr:LysM peptidoglycan-binding domain-containing protein [Mariniphaga sp.]
MKKFQLTIIMYLLALGLAGCSSQKGVQKSAVTAPENSAFISENTETVEKDKPEPENMAVKPVIHVVKKGESLWVIAKQYGVTVKAIAEANNITNSNMIKINQKLIIPEKK